ncbi:hypothetical protein [Micromonospora sp. 4G55]|uniref:hypothetical protein n=1 Tax=Micromonospora sp. 4G55 TaxID=2806102 RepID=UPI001A4E0A72|nr:hypothetical protein [Micromonospora sp. 4G55]MBM0257373.1 hypothetical protein [Micromonospora sp. 4G55]
MAAKLRKPLMPHQRLIADVAMELDPVTGLPAYSEVVVIGPRQTTGKTELLLPVMTHRCVGFGPSLTEWIRRELGVVVPEPGPQTVVYTAQTADDARKKWRDVHVARLEKSSYRRQFTPRLRLNAEAMLWRDGSRWSPASTTGKTGGTGDTIDLPVIDEAWSRPDSRTELGLRPASMTRPWRQMWVTSMIPGLSRAAPGTWPYLQRKRQVGRARVQAGITRGTAFFDFSAAPGLDPGDPQTWWTCMPGLGRTTPESAVRDDFDAMVAAGNLVDFCAEYLGWEPTEATKQWRVIRKETWSDLEDPDSAAAGSVALCLDADPEGQQGYITAAGRRVDADWHVEVCEPGQLIPEGTTGLDWAERRLLDMVDNPETDVCAVVIDPRGGAAPAIASLRPKLAERGVPLLTPSTVEVSQACRRLYDATGEEAKPEDGGGDVPPTRVRHLNQPELNRAWAGARKLESPTYGTFVWARLGNAVSISPLYGVTLALHGYVIAAPDDYDLLDSVAGYDGECPECGASPAPGTERIEHDPECPLLGG